MEEQLRIQTNQPHFSGIVLAKILEDVFDLSEYEVVLPYVALSEQAEGQKMINALQQQVHQAAGTATGIGNDFDLNAPMQAAAAPQTGAPPAGARR